MFMVWGPDGRLVELKSWSFEDSDTIAGGDSMTTDAVKSF
jgi:hypothetical protein